MSRLALTPFLPAGMERHTLQDWILYGRLPAVAKHGIPNHSYRWQIRQLWEVVGKAVNYGDEETQKAGWELHNAIIEQACEYRKMRELHAAMDRDLEAGILPQELLLTDPRIRSTA